MLAVAAATTATVGLGAGTAEAEGNAACLWAGQAHSQGETVSAGGSTFNCGTDERGAAYWFVGGDANSASWVANPGSYTNPTGLFSAGARQPGTDYNDYCVGSQLIEGSEDVYQAVADRNGVLFWKAAMPIAQWSGAAPQQSWRSSSSCYDGSLI